MSITYRQVQEQLREVGVLMSKRGGRIRINHFAGIEETAHYTDSLEDALRTGLAMARPKQLPTMWCASRARSKRHRSAVSGKVSA